MSCIDHKYTTNFLHLQVFPKKILQIAIFPMSENVCDIIISHLFGDKKLNAYFCNINCNLYAEQEIIAIY